MPTLKAVQMKYNSVYLESLNDSKSNYFFFFNIQPFRALCHYNPVTGTNKQSYSNINYQSALNLTVHPLPSLCFCYSNVYKFCCALTLALSLLAH